MPPLIGALAARHLAADVGVVGDVGDERHQPAIEEDRARKCQIGQVRSAAHVRIVREEAVTGAETVRRIAPGDVLHETEEGAQMEGGDRGQGEEVARGVEDRDRAVAPFLDVRGVRGLDQGGHHLVSRGREAVRDDLGGDWIATRFHRRFPAERRILHPCRRCPIRPAGRQDEGDGGAGHDRDPSRNVSPISCCGRQSARGGNLAPIPEIGETLHSMRLRVIRSFNLLKNWIFFTRMLVVSVAL